MSQVLRKGEGTISGFFLSNPSNHRICTVEIWFNDYEQGSL